MSQFNLKITDAGRALFADLIAGSNPLAVTKLAIGSGDLPEGVTAEEMTALADQEAEQNVVTVTADDEVVTVRGDFTNAELVAGYSLKELGVFAADPDEGPDILIAYGNAGDNAGYMPAEGTNALTLIMQAIFTVSGGLAVTVNIDPGAYVDLVTWGTHLAGAGGANQHPLATIEDPGMMSAADKSKLDGILRDYILIVDEKAAGIDGGTFTSGSWQTRELNTEKVDAGNHASLAANQITLAAGTYEVRISCPAGGVLNHQARLRNITDNTTALVGTSERTDREIGENNWVHWDLTATTRSLIVGRITIAEEKTFEVQHRCIQTRATDGFGRPAGFDEVEVYTVAEFYKVG